MILSYWKSRHLGRLVRAVDLAGLPARTPVYYGNYWGSGRPSEPKPPKGPKPKLAGRLSPIFPLMQKTVFHRARRLKASLRQQLPTSVRWKRRGRVPSMKRLLRMSSGARYRWGLELGRRWRDRIRTKRQGQRVVSWQMDEIPHEIAGRGGSRLRVYIRGVLRGVSRGRPQLGDKLVPGIVWITQPALKIAGRPARGTDLALFWKELDRSTIYLVGEEYPDFTGNPRRAARRQSRGQARLWHAGGARRSLSKKYVAGMTPGYRLNTGLGGNIRHRGRPAVRRWRRSYVRSRAAKGVAGFAQFNFRHKNAAPAVMNDVLRAMAQGVRTARR